MQKIVLTPIHEQDTVKAMYGKCFESMYEGSMIGAGMHVFAVWNYIITKARGGAVEINPKLLAFTLGGTEDMVRSALGVLSSPDPDSRSKLEGGRRIMREGEFQYRLVNWEYYQRIRSAEDKREYNRVKQAEYRALDKKKKKLKGGQPDGGAAQVARQEDRFDIPSERLPSPEEY